MTAGHDRAESSVTFAGIRSSYLATIKSEMVHVVTEGYNADAKKNTCKATLHITAPDFKPQEASIVFVSRLTEEMTQSGKHAVLVETLGLEPLVETVMVFARSHYTANRYAGNWSGTYRCTGIDGAEGGPQGPYSQPVTMVVDGIDGKLERTTKGGGIEKVVGRIGSQLFLEGKGQNSPEDLWVTKFEGKVEGKRLTAEGTIGLPHDPRTMTPAQVLRKCELDLVQEARK